MKNNTSLNQSCGILYGYYPQLIDHLAPFCYLNNLPLFVTEPDVYQIICKYYPKSDAHLVNYEQFPTKTISFQHLVSCHWTCNLKQIYFIAELLQNKEISTIWLPHGMSDKGFDHSLKELLKGESQAIVYGSKMKQELFEQTHHVSCVGNFRYTYYQQHDAFYFQILHSLWNIDSDKKNILFAPTWVDAKYKNEFFSACETIFSDLNNDYQLWIKFHPRTEQEYEYEILRLKEAYPTCRFIENIPFIYPILSFIDLYIGDYSSIGYDFLIFDKPMLFVEFHSNNSLSQKEKTLHQCGITIPVNKLSNITDVVKQAFDTSQHHLSSVRKNLYQYSYS